MPQPIQGPTLADVATNVARREKEIKSRGKVSGRGQAQLKKLAESAKAAGATKKDLGRQRAIAKEMSRYGKKGGPSTKRRNALFNESGRIAKRARAAAASKKAAAVKKAKKAKAAKKAVKKTAKKTRPAKKVAKKVAKKAAPVKKAAKKRR
jgi:hypothetical protein